MRAVPNLFACHTGESTRLRKIDPGENQGMYRIRTPRSGVSGVLQSCSHAIDASKPSNQRALHSNTNYLHSPTNNVPVRTLPYHRAQRHY